jgi:hypothetical protein
MVRSTQLLGDLCPAVAYIARTKDLDPQEMRSVCESMIALAHTTRAAGLSTYCSVCLHVLEQLTPMIEANYVSGRVASVLHAWIMLSRKYLREPKDLIASAELIENLGDSRWERPVGRAHREALLAGLLDDWLELRTSHGSPHVRTHSTVPSTSSRRKHAVR